MTTKDKISGVLEVGHTEDTHEVVVNHPDLKPDAQGVGHIVFSPHQARNLANLLTEHADIAEAEANAEVVKSTGFRVRIIFHTPDADKKTRCPENIRFVLGEGLDMLGLSEEIDYTLEVTRSYS